MTAAPDRQIILQQPGDTLREPRPDAVLIEFQWRGRSPSNPEAVKNAPESVLRTKTLQGKPGIYIEGRDIRFCLDGNYNPSIMLKPEELDELLNWLDTYFSDLGSDPYGGHWRTAPGAYAPHCFRAVDYTQEEIDQIVAREKLWSTFDDFLNDSEPSIRKG